MARSELQMVRRKERRIVIEMVEENRYQLYVVVLFLLYWLKTEMQTKVLLMFSGAMLVSWVRTQSLQIICKGATAYFNLLGGKGRAILIQA